MNKKNTKKDRQETRLLRIEFTSMLIIFGITVLLLCVGLSGCNEQNNNGGEYTIDEDDFEILDYTVESWNDVEGISGDTKIGDGFIHTEEVNRYLIKGTLKNNGNKKQSIEIIAKFYDDFNWFVIERTSGMIFDVQPNSPTEFAISLHKEQTDDFELIELVSLSPH